MLILCLAVAAPTVKAQETGSDTPQDLLERIDTLEKRLRKMEDEAKARKTLEITEEEKEQKEKEVLSAVSREYSLDPQGSFSLDYSLGYSYTPSEVIYTAEEALTRLKRESNHTIQHTISASYSILDNLAASMSLPVVYKYNKMGTDEELDETDIADMSLGLAYQPFKGEAGGIRTTVSCSGSLPTGRSPFDINPETELSTGNGYYALSAGANFSKQVDPVVLFWNLGLTYPFKLTGLNHRVAEGVVLDMVDPGSSVSAGLGMGYALSYANSINMSFSYSYKRSTSFKYENMSKTYESGDEVSASFGLGMGINVSAKTTVSVSLGYSLTNSAFSLSTRVPFNFML
jgi:hypothetical protein